MPWRLALVAGCVITGAGQACAAETGSPADAAAPPLRLSAQQLFALAEDALARGDVALAEAAYQALADDPDVRTRSEARFRLGMVRAAQKRYGDAALLFRKILDEQPGSQRVRLELARVLDLLGDEAGARRALREAQAGGLPPDVARIVEHYADALRAQKPFGASIQLALAPDSNINRAPQSPTLQTVIGDFVLGDDARPKSGVGLTLEGQVYGRLPINEQAKLLIRATGTGNLYRQGAFNDIALGVSAGPEYRLGADRLSAEAALVKRWYGGATYSTSTSAIVNYLHPVDRQSQLRAAASLGVVDNDFNRLQDGRNYALSISYERAVSGGSGFSVRLTASREDSRDRGYSNVAANGTLLAYRDIGAATLVATVAYGRLEADRRLFIYPRRRVDTLYRSTLALTYRKLQIAGFSPFVRVTAERNRSSVDIYDYRKVRTEFGMERAF